MPLSTSNNPAFPAADDDPLDLPPMPPMAPPSAVAATTPQQTARDEQTQSTREATGTSQPSPTASLNLTATKSSRKTISSPRRIRLGNQGGVIRIAAGAVLDLPVTLVDASGRIELLAEQGAKRPLLRFRPPRESTFARGLDRHARSPRRVAPPQGHRRARSRSRKRPHRSPCGGRTPSAPSSA